MQHNASMAWLKQKRLAITAAWVSALDRLRTLPKSARYIVVTSPILGVALFVGGLYADHFGWSSNHSYITNTLSSLTGFCIGLPFVILILEDIGAASETARKEQYVKRLTASHWRKLDQAVRIYAERDEEIFNEIKLIPEKLVMDLNKVYDNYLFARRGPADYDLRFELWTKQFTDAAEKVSQASDEYALLRSRIGADVGAWESLQVSWINIDGPIKDRRRDLLLPLLSPTQSNIVEWAFRKGDLRPAFSEGIEILRDIQEWLLDGAQNAQTYIKQPGNRYLQLIGDYVMGVSPGKDYLALRLGSGRMAEAFIQFAVLKWVIDGIDLQDFQINPPEPPLDVRPWQLTG